MTKPTLHLLDDGGNRIGTKITCIATFAGGAWSAGTASGTFNTPGGRVAAIQAQGVDPADPRKNAFWVEIVQTTLADHVDLDDLPGGHPAGENAAVAALDDTGETEIEWQVLQPRFVDEITKAIDLAGNPVPAIGFEFYKYVGRFDIEGLVDPLTSQIPHGNLLNPWVGNGVGEQIAGFNAVQGAPAAVPEPEPWMPMLGGPGLPGVAARRRVRS